MSPADILAERIAASLVRHEPGWRLPRHTDLARHYNVSAAQIEAAIGELAARHLVRRLPDGQVYRASPAEYFIRLEGLPGLTSTVDPMGHAIACQSRDETVRRPPQEIGWALGLAPEGQVRVIRCLWTADGEPAATCTTYLAGHLAGTVTGAQDAAPEAVALNRLPLPATSPEHDGEDGVPSQAWRPRALFVEMRQPPPSVARSLRLSAGQPAAIVTARFGDPGLGEPAAVTIAVLRPDLFRIVVESPAPLLPERGQGSPSGAWTLALKDWES